MRSGPSEAQTNILFDAKKKLEDYDKVMAQYTDFFSSHKPDDIENVIIQFLEAGGHDYKVSEDKYKIKF